MSKIYKAITDAETTNISVTDALNFVTIDANGAETVFVGTVRNHNLGQAVTGITYDVFEPLALESFQEICEEAQSRWGDDLACYVAHVKGRLDIAGISIVIAVGSPHSDEAFKACRFIIEQIKHRSPIWKLEHYVDGDSEWSRGCEACSHTVHEVHEAHP